jgi:hypothetical protein
MPAKEPIAVPQAAIRWMWELADSGSKVHLRICGDLGGNVVTSIGI